jgi:hypothetical protein
MGRVDHFARGGGEYHDVEFEEYVRNFLIGREI